MVYIKIIETSYVAHSSNGEVKMSVKISLGAKKKSFKSIREAAEVVASQTGEKVERVYMRLYMRLRAGKTVASAVKAPARKYTLKAI